MNVTRVTTERILPSVLGLVVAANIEGQGFEMRAAPLVVKFGDIDAEQVVPLGIADGVRAVFSRMPPVGAPLSIGYLAEPLTETTFKWVDPSGDLIA